MALAWASREIPGDVKEAHTLLKKLVRRGVSDGKRRKVWQAVVGTSSTHTHAHTHALTHSHTDTHSYAYTESAKNYAYEAAVRYVFGSGDTNTSASTGSGRSGPSGSVGGGGGGIGGTSKIVQVPAFGGRVRFQVC
jgi:hypothetical protein